MTVNASLAGHATRAPAQLLFLLGEHIEASLSRPVWNAVFGAAGIPLHYLNAQGDSAGLAARFERLRAPDVVAANVTAPHKHAAAGLVDIADPEVARCGACNFVVNRNGVLYGFNTDVTAVRAAFTGRQFGTAVLLGAGGAGAAALSGMRGAVERVLVLDRDRRAADRLVARAADWGPAVSGLDWSQLAVAVRSAAVIVNATPIGSGPADKSPVPAQWLSGHPAIYDFIYAGAPVFAPLAAVAGCPLHDGLAHWVDQAIGMLGELGLDPGLAGAIRAAAAREAGGRAHSWDADTGRE